MGYRVSARSVLGGCAQELPVVAFFMPLGLVLSFLMYAWIVVQSADFGRETIAIALPEVREDPTWSEQVERFAVRLESAFGISDKRATEFSAWILEAGRRQKLAPELIAGLVHTESSFRKGVRSATGAIGPAQVNPRYWERHCGGGDLSDPGENIYCGAQVLAHFMERCGKLDCALARYNVGARNLSKPYYRGAGLRYITKVDEHRDQVANAAL
jgi:soluble lytic murein transglycosylase-like protein